LDMNKMDRINISDLQLRPEVFSVRLQRRAALRDLINKQMPTINAAVEKQQLDEYFSQALSLVVSGKAREAFDLSQESEVLKDAYGRNTFGQSCLLARRLVEQQVPFVTVVQPGWDTHENMIVPLREGYSGAKIGVGLIPTFDQAVSALIEDLSDQGLLDQTLVIAMGEFGRTPKVNTRGGRDHWPRVYSVMLCGGGLPQGIVLGSSDRIGESPRDNPITPSDLIRTLLIRLGIEPDRMLVTPDGRPIPINQHGKPIDALL